jgi:aminopeptidase N
MLSSEPGSDMQLTWADAYISSSDSPADLDFIAGLLDGSSDVPGLAVDTNVRWHVVNILAVNNRISDTEIEREAKRDGTDQGARNALTARALRPTAKAKALAWGKITSDPDLSLYDRRAWLAGFMHPRQEKLLAPYVAKYAQLVPQLWSGDWTPVEARALTEGLYPTPVVSDQTVAMVDDVLKEDLPPPARKILLDQQDGTRRALHARAVDSAACPDQGSRQL